MNDVLPPPPPTTTSFALICTNESSHELAEASALQLCRFDSEDFVGNSRTVAFRRKKTRKQQQVVEK